MQTPFSPLVFLCCCPLTFLLVHYWTNGQHCCRSLSHFSFLLYFPMMRSHRQFQPVHNCIPANRNYSALLLTPCSGCMFKPPLPSCQRWRSQGHAGSIFNSPTENFCLFCLHIPLAQPANAAVVYWCYRQTKRRERFGNAPLLSSSLKSGSNWEIISPEIWCMTTTLFSCIIGTI